MIRPRAVAWLAAGLLVAGACTADPLALTNPNSPTVAGAAGDAAALQLQATGVLRQLRGGFGAYITTTARLGREGYIYTPNEGRNTSHYLIGLAGENRLDPSGFATGVWALPYGNLRDLFNLRNVLTSHATLSAEQKSAGLGFARTIEALELFYVISTRDSLGAVVQVNQDASDLAPFVSRDSVYRYILGTLDAGNAELTSGGTTFPFSLHAGFAGFNTPAAFRLFNRAVAARVAVHFATRGGGAAAWTAAQAALGASFLDRATASSAAMQAGVYHVHSTATGDAANGLGLNADFLAHPSHATDVMPGDLRAVKWSVLGVERDAPQGLGIPTNLSMARYASNTASIPVIRNEELLLLDAEVRWNTGDKAGAIADLNQVRSVSGGAAIGPTAATVASSDAAFIDALLYERRFSLLAEGHRWIDHRRLGRLAALPRDLTTGVNAHFVARVMPVPQAECLVRARANDPALDGPGC
ncbi:MAG: RagB/SusD family nutrient uptake outer membrane protein [Gemmatimonadaceae bacterium]|nr:RagB/SusD family nutrient uptake outer membrane protein [Gemmatimonadaceae bacterium]